MTDDCIHQVQLCPTCGGLQAQRMERLEGVATANVVLTPEEGAPITFTAPLSLYVVAPFEPCPAEADQ